MKIETPEQALDTILEMVQMTEADFEMALSATVTIYRLMERGFGDLSLEVLNTYKPNGLSKEWSEHNEV